MHILPDLHFTIRNQITNTVFTNIFQLKKKTKLLIGQSWFSGPLKKKFLRFEEPKRIIINIGRIKMVKRGFIDS